MRATVRAAMTTWTPWTTGTAGTTRTSMGAVVVSARAMLAETSAGTVMAHPRTTGAHTTAWAARASRSLVAGPAELLRLALAAVWWRAAVLGLVVLVHLLFNLVLDRAEEAHVEFCDVMCCLCGRIEIDGHCCIVRMTVRCDRQCLVSYSIQASQTGITGQQGLYVLIEPFGGRHHTCSNLVQVKPG
jgi:hypothetical protein